MNTAYAVSQIDNQGAITGQTYFASKRAAMKFYDSSAVPEGGWVRVTVAKYTPFDKGLRIRGRRVLIAAK